MELNSDTSFVRFPQKCVDFDNRSKAPGTRRRRESTCTMRMLLLHSGFTLGFCRAYQGFMKNSVRVQCEFSCFGETGNDTLHHILLVYMTCSSVHVLFVCLFGCVYKRASAFLCSTAISHKPVCRSNPHATIECAVKSKCMVSSPATSPAVIMSPSRRADNVPRTVWYVGFLQWDKESVD